MTIECSNDSDHELDTERLTAVARHVLDVLGVDPLAELSMVLVGVAEMTELHVQWMDLPGPTDVMAFPMDELDVRGGVPHTGPGPLLLGDVVLCPDVAQQQAAEAGHSLTEELELLTTHGVLHLLGYDHAEPEEHAEMFGLQGELLASWRAAR